VLEENRGLVPSFKLVLEEYKGLEPPFKLVLEDAGSCSFLENVLRKEGDLCLQELVL
jgi:hypothetical protein